MSGTRGRSRLAPHRPAMANRFIPVASTPITLICRLPRGLHKSSNSCDMPAPAALQARCRHQGSKRPTQLLMSRIHCCVVPRRVGLTLTTKLPSKFSGNWTVYRGEVPEYDRVLAVIAGWAVPAVQARQRSPDRSGRVWRVTAYLGVDSTGRSRIRARTLRLLSAQASVWG